MVVVAVGDAGGTFAAGLITMPLRLSSKTWMAKIIAIGSPWFDGGLDYTSQGPSGHHTLAETSVHTHRLGEPATGKCTPLTYFFFRNNGRSKCESCQRG